MIYIVTKGRKTMKKEQIKIDDKVRAIFRKYGRHEVIGTVFEISTDEHALQGTWVSIKVTGGDVNDKQVSWMVANRINVMVPASDVVEVLQ